MTKKDIPSFPLGLGDESTCPTLNEDVFFYTLGISLPETNSILKRLFLKFGENFYIRHSPYVVDIIDDDTPHILLFTKVSLQNPSEVEVASIKEIAQDVCNEFAQILGFVVAFSIHLN